MFSPGPPIGPKAAAGPSAGGGEGGSNELASIPPRTGRFILLGSFRAALGADAWEAGNPRRSRAIVREVSLEQPDFVGLLGDLVFCGSSGDAWLEYDRLTAPLKTAGIPIYPVLGNHEYWLSSRAALGNYFGRFPRLAGRHWYAARYGPLGLAFLDSNAQWLSMAAWREQCAWLARLLAGWDADEAISGGLVLLYHPPFTRERATADTQRVQRDFVPLFAAARKTLAMVSGHSNGESRRAGGKAYLVASRRPPDAGGPARRALAPELPPFRWLSVSVSAPAVVIETRELRGDEATATTLESLSLS